MRAGCDLRVHGAPGMLQEHTQPDADLICVKDAPALMPHAPGMSVRILRSAVWKLGFGRYARRTSAAHAPARRTAWLVPREHGAYGQVALPLGVAHLSGTTGWAAWLLTLAALAAFVSHEPLMVALGRRGDRARSRAGSRALRLLIVTAGIGLVLAAAGLTLGSSSARWSALGCAGLALLLAVQVARDAERSLMGELLVAATLPALAVPVALSARVPAGAAVGAWLVWTLGFAGAICVVRDTVAHHKRGRPLPLRLAPLAVIAALAGSASTLGWLQHVQVAALTPILVTLLAIAARPPHPRHLRRVGWILLVASTTTAALLIL